MLFLSSHLISCLLGLSLLAASSLAQSAPTLQYALQTQLPPVARVNQTFIWSLLPDTFLSSTPMSYAALDMPDWLSFDARTLTFSGQPTLDDVASNYVVVQANSTDSAVGTQSGFHCLVVNDPAPVINIDFASQLANGNAVFSSSYLQEDGSIRVPPRWSFSVGFQYNTFTDPQGQTIYYTAYRHATTSLPNWLTFDNETVTFDGLGPSNTAYFEIDLFGSDHYGYGDVVQTLKIVIGTHSFIQTTALPPINATAREEISYTVPISGFQLDGRQVSAANLTSVAVNVPSNLSYLSYDPSSRVISGTVPSEIPSTSDVDIPVVFTSVFNDTIVSNLTFHFIPQLFADERIPTFNITGGRSFEYDLSQYLINTEATYSSSVSPAEADSWLNFDAAARRLSGTPPADSTTLNDILVNITGSAPSSGITESATSRLLYTRASGNLQEGKKKGLSSGALIAIAVVFGVLGGILLLLLIMFLCRRYCTHEDNVDDDATLAAASMREKGKSPAMPSPDADRRTSISSRDSDRLSAAIAAAELSVAAALAAEKEKAQPRRMNLMNVFKRESSMSNIAGVGAQPRGSTALASGRSLKELLGLAPSTRDVAGAASRPHSPDQPRRHDIIVVTDGDGYTYRPGTPADPNAQGTTASPGAPVVAARRTASGLDSGASERTRSSFDSQQSSNIWYSEESASQNGSPVQRPRMARTRNSAGSSLGTPRSIPRQRQDFRPYRPTGPPRKISSTPQLDSHPEMPDTSGVDMYLVESEPRHGQDEDDVSPSPSRMPPGGIRIVETRDSSGSLRSDLFNETTNNHSGSYEGDDFEQDQSLAADAAITMATLENISTEHGRQVSAAASLQSSDARPVTRPRLIPFTSERRGERSESPPERRYPSQKGIHAAGADMSMDSHASSSRLGAGSSSGMLRSTSRGTQEYDDSTEDATHDENVQRYSTASTPYAPPADGETSSPIFFTRPLADKRASPLSHSTSAAAQRQPVPAGASSSQSNPSSLRSGRSRANSIVVDPLRIQLGAGEPFHFTAQIHPPPSASIGSPGRNGPVRSAYFAYTDYPDAPEFDGLALPDWLHFDPRELEFWGIPRAADAGSVAVRVIERKTYPTPGSPGRRHVEDPLRTSWGKNPHDSVSSVGGSTVVGASGSGAADESEQIVGRFVLDVTDRRSVGSLGDVVAITY